MSAWENPDVPDFLRGSDKIAHAGLYTILGMSLGWGRLRAFPPPPHFLPILVGAIYGATDEWHQGFVRGRSPDLTDWLADITGVVLGYLLILLIFSRRKTSDAADHGVDVSS